MLVPRDIGSVISAIRARLPDVAVTQVRAKHPGADDDGLWFFSHPAGQFEAQLESPDGQFPFLLESDGTASRDQADSIDAAASGVIARLGLPTGMSSQGPGVADV